MNLKQISEGEKSANYPSLKNNAIYALNIALHTLTYDLREPVL